MKTIRANEHLKIISTAFDGGAGIIRLPRDNKTGFTKATVVWSYGGGWEHVSIAPLNGTMPKWEDMCFTKELFWDDTEWVVQYHPPKSEYVNNLPNCLHLWRPIEEELPTPPSIFVGIKGVELK